MNFNFNFKDMPPAAGASICRVTNGWSALRGK